MKRAFEIVVGIVGTAVFLAGGSAILIENFHNQQRANASHGWLQVQGVVVRSTIEHGRATLPCVQYTYKVAGVNFSSRQISVDYGTGPGGTGTAARIVARYPEGQPVTVYVDPEDWSQSVLEPGVYPSFLTQLFMGVMFAGGGVWLLWSLFRFVFVGAANEPVRWTPRKGLIGTLLMSVLVYAILILATIGVDKEIFVQAFGQSPMGMPALVLVCLLLTILYIPAPWIFWHGTRLAFQAAEDRRLGGLGYLLWVGRNHPELRRSQ